MLILPTDERLAWLLVRTKPKQESRVVEQLVGRAAEVYCPRVVEPRSHRRAPRGPVPLFPSYLFARHSPAAGLAALNYCPGVGGIVRFGDYLAAVDDAFVTALQEREGARGHLVFGEVRRDLPRGSRVRIVNGPLSGLEGVVAKYMPGKERVRLLLEVVRSVRTVEVDARHVRCA